MERKRKRQSGVEFWTAAKCQRLLRPIASRIAPLRRNQYALNSEPSHKVVQEEPSSGITPHNISRRDTTHPNIDTASLDPTWLPSDQKNKSQLKKYSARHRSSQTLPDQTNSPQACLVVLPTPFKQRASRRGTPLKKNMLTQDTSNSPCAPRSLPLAGKGDRRRKDPFTRAPIAKQSIELQGRQNYERTFELHQGVTDGFSLLLQRTNPTEPGEPSPKGASSLLNYIRAEEDWRKSIDEDDDTDVSAEVYEELEDLGSVQGHGWAGLREVVIAHGVSLVNEIIKDKLVATETRAELARIPAKYGLHKASENLLLAYAQSLPLKRPLGVESRLFNGCLSSLTTIQPASANNEVFVRLLDALFSSGRLKMSWLATRDMVTLSSGMIRALASQNGEFSHILQFLQGRISQISGAELKQKNAKRQGPEGNLDIWLKLDKSLGNTTVSIITVLTAIVLIERSTRVSTGTSERCTAAESLLARLSVIVLARLGTLEHEYSASSSHQPRAVCFTLLASSLILSVNHDNKGREQMSLSKKDILQGMAALHEESHPHRSQTIVERAAVFLVDLSRCCGQSLYSDSQSYLESLVRSIMEDSEHGSDKVKTFLKQWAMESSLLSVKISATQRSRVFLDVVETAMTQHKPLQSTAIVLHHVRAPSVEPALRWEEGLCEWIVASPLRTRKANKIVSSANRDRSKSVSDQDSDLDDSGYLSEAKETPKLERKRFNMSNMLASPDVLGFDLEMPSCLDFEEQPEAYKTETKARKVSPGRRSQKSCMFQSRMLKSDSVQAITMIPKAETNAVMPNEGFEIAERPAKKTKNQITRASKPEASALLPAAPQISPEQESKEHTTEQEPDLSESEMDELAMSCSRPRRRAPVIRKVVPCKSFGKNLLLPKRASSHMADISDDELGF
ncbi:hypothetical protein E4T52_00363 [Aureobasidium sp. EXF-3400]|nr:hypothetical protein E4T51_02338 [Aureobasidium sp. EXF-12344]KAI4784687.1 hypothetical protein E4T52_00363 [Aureobasidium sp. EXF-3400]